MDRGDEISLIYQLGFDPNVVAEAYARRVYRGELPKLPNGNVERVHGQTTPKPLPPKTSEGFDPEDHVRRAIHEIWNWRMLNAIRDYYAPNAIVHTAGRRDLYGYGDQRAYILALIAAFPDCEVEVDHVQHIGNAAEGYRVAVRWTLSGHHRGYGIYGAPTGGPVRIIGSRTTSFATAKSPKSGCSSTNWPYLSRSGWRAWQTAPES